MDFVFRCPHCDQALEVDSGGVGSEIICPSCNHPILVPPPGPQGGRRSAQAQPPATPERLLSLAGVKGSDTLIQKPSRPLDVAAKVADKKFHVKTIRRSDCQQGDFDAFDSTVTEFLEKLPSHDVVSVTPVSYSRFDAAKSQALVDYGVLIVYKI